MASQQERIAYLVTLMRIGVERSYRNPVKWATTVFAAAMKKDPYFLMNHNDPEKDLQHD